MIIFVFWLRYWFFVDRCFTVAISAGGWWCVWYLNWFLTLCSLLVAPPSCSSKLPTYLSNPPLHIFIYPSVFWYKSIFLASLLYARRDIVALPWLTPNISEVPQQIFLFWLLSCSVKSSCRSKKYKFGCSCCSKLSRPHVRGTGFLWQQH